MARFEASNAQYNATIFGFAKTPALYKADDIHFESWGKDGNITPAAVTNGWTEAIATVSGVDQSNVQAQVLHPAEYSLFCCGVPAPVEVMRDVIKKLSPFAQSMGNWEQRKVAYIALCQAQSERASNPKKGSSKLKNDQSVADDEEEENMLFLRKKESSKLKKDQSVADDEEEEKEEEAEQDGDEEEDGDEEVDGDEEDDGDDSNDEKTNSDMFETLTLVNGKLPPGMLSGGAASVTGNLDVKVRELARDLNDHCTATCAVLRQIFKASDLPVLQRASDDFKKRTKSEMTRTIAEAWLGLRHIKIRDFVNMVEEAVLNGEDKVMVANRVVKQALNLKIDLNDEYPINALAAELNNIEDALSQLGSPASQMTQMSWLVGALRSSESGLFKSLGRKTAGWMRNLLKQSPTGQGTTGDVQKLVGKLRSHELVQTYEPKPTKSQQVKSDKKGRGKAKDADADEDGELEDHLSNFTDLTSVQCWTCQEFGHRANKCPKKTTKGKGGKGGGKGKGKGGKGKGKGGGGKGSGFAGGAGTKAVEDDEDEDFDDDSTTASEDSSSDYQSHQAAEEEHHEIDDAAICEAVVKLKRDLRAMKLADGTRRHSKKDVQMKILKYEDDLYSGIKSL